MYIYMCILWPFRLCVKIFWTMSESFFSFSEEVERKTEELKVDAAAKGESYIYTYVMHMYKHLYMCMYMCSCKQGSHTCIYTYIYTHKRSRSYTFAEHVYMLICIHAHRHSHAETGRDDLLYMHRYTHNKFIHSYSVT